MERQIEAEILEHVRARYGDMPSEVVFMALVRVAARLCLESITVPEDRARQEIEGFTVKDKGDMMAKLAPFQKAIEGLFDVQD